MQRYIPHTQFLEELKKGEKSFIHEALGNICYIGGHTEFSQH